MIVGLSGKQGSGKTTIAKLLVEALTPQRTRVVKFATPIYQIHDAVNKVYVNHGINCPKKDGLLLQWIGTEHGRQTKGDNVWVDIAKRSIINASRDGLHALVDDLRFKNEFTMLEAENATLIRLVCPTDVRKYRADSWREDHNHKSETDLDEYMAAGRFHLVIDTWHQSPKDILDTILKYLDKHAV